MTNDVRPSLFSRVGKTLMLEVTKVVNCIVRPNKTLPYRKVHPYTVLEAVS